MFITIHKNTTELVKGNNNLNCPNPQEFFILIYYHAAWHTTERWPPRRRGECYLNHAQSSLIVDMDTDEILEEIGSYGLFQKRNSLLLGLIIFVLTFQTVSMVFIGGEPRWRCKGNSSICTRNETFSSYDGFYKARCNMSSDDWEFTTEFTSIITEVGLLFFSKFGQMFRG